MTEEAEIWVPSSRSISLSQRLGEEIPRHRAAAVRSETAQTLVARPRARIGKKAGKKHSLVYRRQALRRLLAEVPREFLRGREERGRSRGIVAIAVAVAHGPWGVVRATPCFFDDESLRASSLEISPG